MSRRPIVIACLVAASLAGTGSASAQDPAPLPGTVQGVGEVTPPGCDGGAYKVPFASLTDAGDTWIVGRPAAVAVACDAIVYGTATVFLGGWNPVTGGCLEAALGGAARICIGAMPHRGVLNGVSFRYCPDRERCFLGEAWLARG